MVWDSWIQDAEGVTSSRQRALGPQWPTDEQPNQDAKEVLWPREKIWVNIAIRHCLHSFLTHNKHHPLENKVWEIYIFIKKCIRSLLKSSLTVNDVSACKCIFVYVQLQLYVAIQHLNTLGRQKKILPAFTKISSQRIFTNLFRHKILFYSKRLVKGQWINVTLFKASCLLPKLFQFIERIIFIASVFRLMYSMAFTRGTIHMEGRFFYYQLGLVGFIYHSR